MKKTTLLSILVVAVQLTIGIVAEAQQPKKAYRIGYLSTQDSARESARLQAIRVALREPGYIEGQNVAIEYRYTEGNRDRQHEHAAELARLPVDVIFATSATIALVAKNSTRTIPIVFLSAAEPVASGLAWHGPVES